MAEYSGPDRRATSEVLSVLNKMHVEMTDRFARLETKWDSQVPRCDSHAENLHGLHVRMGAVEKKQESIPWLKAWIGAAWAAILGGIWK